MPDDDSDHQGQAGVSSTLAGSPTDPFAGMFPGARLGRTIAKSLSFYESQPFLNPEEAAEYRSLRQRRNLGHLAVLAANGLSPMKPSPVRLILTADGPRPVPPANQAPPARHNDTFDAASGLPPGYSAQMQRALVEAGADGKWLQNLQDIVAQSELNQQVIDWRAHGWDIAADMLNHFLYGRGKPFSLPLNDLKQLETNAQFSDAIVQNILSRFPDRPTSDPFPAMNSFQADFNWSPFHDNQLFYAFHDLKITYSGTVQYVAIPVRGNPVGLLRHYNLKISIWKSYNFNPTSHGWIDYHFPTFDEAWQLQQNGAAHAFDLDSSWDLVK